jgi:hypothetical protein
LLRIDDGQDYYYWLWIAYEPNLNTCLRMHLSLSPSLPQERKNYFRVCYQFFRQLRNRYDTRKPIYTEMVL